MLNDSSNQCLWAGGWQHIKRNLHPRSNGGDRSEYQNIYIRNILTTTGRAYLADDDDWIIIVLEVTRQVSSYTNFEQFMRGLLKWKPQNIISTE